MLWQPESNDFAAWLEFCLGRSWRVEPRAVHGRSRFRVTNLFSGQSEDFDDGLMHVDHPLAAIQGRFEVALDRVRATAKPHK